MSGAARRSLELAIGPNRWGGLPRLFLAMVTGFGLACLGTCALVYFPALFERIYKIFAILTVLAAFSGVLALLGVVLHLVRVFLFRQPSLAMNAGGLKISSSYRTRFLAWVNVADADVDHAVSDGPRSRRLRLYLQPSAQDAGKPPAFIDLQDSYAATLETICDELLARRDWMAPAQEPEWTARQIDAPERAAPTRRQTKFPVLVIIAVLGGGALLGVLARSARDPQILGWPRPELRFSWVDWWARHAGLAGPHLVPENQLPRNDAAAADGIPRLARDYPQDLRAQFMFAEYQVKHHDIAGAEALFRDTINLAEQWPLAVHVASVNAMRATYALFLDSLGRKAAARSAAAIPCAAGMFARPTEDILRSLRQAGLCQ